MKTSRIAATLLLFAAAVIAVAVLIRPRERTPEPASQSPDVAVEATAFDSIPTQAVPEVQSAPPPNIVVGQPVVAESPVDKPPVATNKLDRLAQIRETFRKLAAGDKLDAMRAAKQVTDPNERETALLTLVAEWTHGELGSPQLRAERIARVGLEAGLGMELAKNPELALMWADELTEGDGRANVLQVVARFLVDSDPAAAFALSQQVPETGRRGFSDAIFANWASHDTDAALKWAEQFPDAAEREAAIQAIRTSAPVGIGTALGMQDGYPVITDLVPGTPAERSGQLHAGDRIVAIAQAGGAFTDLNEVSLQNVVEAIRGAPNTMLQLKVVPAGAAPNTPPKTVLIVRDQIKFKK